MTTSIPPFSRSLDLLVTFVGLLLFGATIPVCVVNLLGGSGVPLAILLWGFLCFGARLIFLLTGGLGKNLLRKRPFGWVCFVCVIPCAAIALAFPVGRGSHEITCVHQLRQLAGAKETWAYENKSPEGTAVLWENICGTNGYLKTVPICPQGGKYTLGKVGQNPRCSLDTEGHRLLGPY